jgi:hypothetical protein
VQIYPPDLRWLLEASVWSRNIVTDQGQHIVALVEEEASGYAWEQNENKLFPKGVPVMIISSYAARANLYHLWQQHPDCQHAQFVAALGSSEGLVKKWLKRLQEELAQGVPLYASR